VTSGGKNISPSNIENRPGCVGLYRAGCRHRRQQEISLGANRARLCDAGGLGEGENISFESRKDLIGNAEVINLYEKEIGEAMKDWARVEQIRKFKLMEKEWSQDTDELTPTMKLKRMVVNKKYSAQIEEMYVE